MNLFMTRTTQLYFGYQAQKPKEASLQKLATTQELTFASFSQPIGWSAVSSFYLTKHSKTLALMAYLSFFKVISSQTFIYKTSGFSEKKPYFIRFTADRRPG